MMWIVLVPTLGPRGIGWVGLQSLGIVAVGVADAVWPGDRDSILAPVLIPLGIALFFGGIGIAAWAIAGLRGARAMTVLPEPLAGGRLVTSGAHGLVRHPVYLGVGLAALGAAIAGLSLPAVGAAVVLFVVFDLKRRREEAWLDDRYPEYAAYRARVPALVPFLY